MFGLFAFLGIFKTLGVRAVRLFGLFGEGSTVDLFCVLILVTNLIKPLKVQPEAKNCQLDCMDAYNQCKFACSSAACWNNCTDKYCDCMNKGCGSNVC